MHLTGCTCAPGCKTRSDAAKAVMAGIEVEQAAAKARINTRAAQFIATPVREVASSNAN